MASASTTRSHSRTSRSEPGNGANIRRFGSKEELISTAAGASRGTIRSQRDETPVGDIASAAKALVETYEAHGDRVLRMLAQEDRVSAFHLSAYH
jgi:hypothetical protein